MSTPSWKEAERQFESFFNDLGKEAFVCRLVDTAVAKALGGKKAFIPPQPSDYIVTVQGDMFFAEVKTTTDAEAFHFSNIRKDQMNAARRTVKAGGTYLFFIKSFAWDTWYCVPAQIIIDTQLNKKIKHLKWSQLEKFKYVP